MSKVTKNARNTNLKSSSKLGNFIRTRSSKRDNAADAIQSDNTIESDNVIGNNTTIRAVNEFGDESYRDSDNVEQSGGRSGNDTSGRNGRTGRGRSDRDTDTGTADDRSGRDSDGDSEESQLDSRNDIPVKKPRKKRTTIADRVAQLVEEENITPEEAEIKVRAARKPRKISSLDSEVEPGVTASVMLIGSLMEGASELIAMASQKPYLQLEKEEARSLSDAWMQVLDTFPKSVRKNFDKIFAKYYPWWNLAKVATAISYPRYVMYQTEKEFKQNAQQSSQQVQ